MLNMDPAERWSVKKALEKATRRLLKSSASRKMGWGMGAARVPFLWRSGVRLSVGERSSAHPSVCMPLCMYTCIHAYVHECILAYLFIHACTCRCILECVHMCTRVCMADFENRPRLAKSRVRTKDGRPSPCFSALVRALLQLAECRGSSAQACVVGDRHRGGSYPQEETLRREPAVDATVLEPRMATAHALRDPGRRCQCPLRLGGPRPLAPRLGGVEHGGGEEARRGAGAPRAGGADGRAGASAWSAPEIGR